MLNHQSGQMADGAIFRYYGLGPSLKIDVDHFTIEESDRILLLSDGVTKVFHPSEAAKFVEEYLDISQAANSLAQRSLALGSTDDITVLLFEVEEIWG